jgi:hypothetical protein
MFGIFIKVFNSRKWKTHPELSPSEVLQYRVDDNIDFWESVKFWMEFASEENYKQQGEINNLRKKLNEMNERLESEKALNRTIKFFRRKK